MPKISLFLELYPIWRCQNAHFTVWMQLQSSSGLASGNPANTHCTVLVNAIKADSSRLLHYYPTRSVLAFQPREVCRTKILPGSLSLHFCPPLLRQGWKHADLTAVFGYVADPTRLRPA